MTDTPPYRVAIWVGETQLPLIKGLSRTPGLEVMALGGDSTTIRDTANQLGAVHAPDPRCSLALRPMRP